MPRARSEPNTGDDTQETTLSRPAIILASALLLGKPGPGAAQHAGHGVPAAPSAVTKAYQPVNARMHQDMNIRFSRDADVDVIRGRILHHIAAVDRATIVLEHGKDRDLKKRAAEIMAVAIMAAQDKEIAFMRKRLNRRGN